MSCLQCSLLRILLLQGLVEQKLFTWVLIWWVGAACTDRRVRNCGCCNSAKKGWLSLPSKIHSACSVVYCTFLSNFQNGHFGKLLLENLISYFLMLSGLVGGVTCDCWIKLFLICWELNRQEVLYCAKKAGATHILKAGGAQACSVPASLYLLLSYLDGWMLWDGTPG